MRTLKGIGEIITKGGIWQKLANPTVNRGKTAWPKSKAEQERIGIRFDYDGEVTQDGVEYHKYHCQPNAGKVPSSIKAWRDKNGGTHAVMASILVKKDGTKDEVQDSVEKAMKEVPGA